jgi:hypothetical protein
MTDSRGREMARPDRRPPADRKESRMTRALILAAAVAPVAALATLHRLRLAGPRAERMLGSAPAVSVEPLFSIALI